MGIVPSTSRFEAKEQAFGEDETNHGGDRTQVKSWSFCNFLQARFLLYRSMSIAPSSARSSRWRSSCSRMSR